MKVRCFTMDYNEEEKLQREINAIEKVGKILHITSNQTGALSQVWVFYSLKRKK